MQYRRKRVYKRLSYYFLKTMYTILAGPRFLLFAGVKEAFYYLFNFTDYNIYIPIQDTLSLNARKIALFYYTVGISTRTIYGRKPNNYYKRQCTVKYVCAFIGRARRVMVLRGETRRQQG